MCHGAGGMTVHIRFGATMGGAPFILGLVLIVLALFFGGSIETLLKLFPPALLGVILFLAGAQLALGYCDFSTDKSERFATLVTAAFAIWNLGAARARNHGARCCRPSQSRNRPGPADRRMHPGGAQSSRHAEAASGQHP